MYNLKCTISIIVMILAFSPPNAPPISAPDVGMLTFTMPQSDPLGPIHCKTKEETC